jgi:predicted acyl esterase
VAFGSAPGFNVAGPAAPGFDVAGPAAPALDRPWHRPGRLGYALTRLREFAKPPVIVTEPPDDIIVDRDAEVRTRDGTVLRVNVFRAPDGDARPVVISAYDLRRVADAHPLRDKFWRSLVPDLSAIRVPMLVCGSFSDHNLHSRGSIRAFTQSDSTHARLYTHRGGEWATFYSEPARAEQLAFIRAALDGALEKTRSVRLEVRGP